MTSLAPDTLAEDGEPRGPREHTGGVLGTALALLAVVGLTVALQELVKGGAIDGEALLTELVEGQPPFALALADAARLPTGEVVVRLERPVPTDAAPAQGPDEVYLIEYPSAASVKRLFPNAEDPGGGGAFEASGQMLAWEKDPKFEWHTQLERDEVAWRGWRTDYIVERLFEEGGSWRDSVRVDLAQPGRFLVAVALWPPETPFAEDELEILLRSVTMRSEP